MKLKQFFAVTLLLAFATCLFATPACAANTSSNPTAELISTDTIVQDSESGIMPLSNTGFFPWLRDASRNRLKPIIF